MEKRSWPLQNLLFVGSKSTGVANIPGRISCEWNNHSRYIKSTPIAREEHLCWRRCIAWGNRNNYFDKWSKWNEMSSSVDSLHYYFLFWNYFELWYKVGRVSAWILTFGANQSFHTEILLPYAIAISWAIKSTFGSFMKNHIRKYWKVWFAYGKSQYFGLSNDAESV